MKTKFLVGMLLAAGSMFAAPRVSIGIGIGHPYVVAPPPVVVYEPAYPVYAAPYPGYGYTWVDGYWYEAGPRRYWHGGYWAPRGYGHANYGRGYRVVPRYRSYRYSYYEHYRR
jgi:hypothetical protein